MRLDTDRRFWRASLYRRPALCAAIAAFALLAVIPGSAAASPLDQSFGSGGIVLTPDPGGIGIAALTLARDDRGRILAGGTSHFEVPVLFRYLPDGEVDRTLGKDRNFGKDGEAESTINNSLIPTALLAEPGGKILMGGGDGASDFVLARWNRSGHLDQGFGDDGVSDTFFRTILNGSGILALATRPDGRIVAGGYGVDALARQTAYVIGYRPNGEIDTGFGDEGFVRFKGGHKRARINGVAVLPSGKILLGGELHNRFLLARLLPNGDRDPSFGRGTGKVMVDLDGDPSCDCSVVRAFALAAGGRPVIAGSIYGPGYGAALLARFRPSGSLDPGFGKGGIVKVLRGSDLASYGLAIGQNGLITTTGYYNVKGTGEAEVAVLRYLPNGKLDRGFARGGFFTRDLGTESVGYAALAYPDGRVVIAGRANPGPRSHREGATAIDGADFMLMRFRP